LKEGPGGNENEGNSYRGLQGGNPREKALGKHELCPSQESKKGEGARPLKIKYEKALNLGTPRISRAEGSQKVRGSSRKHPSQVAGRDESQRKTSKCTLHIGKLKNTGTSPMPTHGHCYPYQKKGGKKEKKN